MDREKIITAAELMDMQFLPRSTVVDGMLPGGCYILAGAPKVGKSFLMAQLCWCVATGTPFLGQPTHRSQVLYLSLEDTGERVQGRLIRMFGVEHPVGRLHLKFETDLRGRDLLAMLEGFFMDHPSVRLVVIDTFQRVREGGGAQYCITRPPRTLFGAVVSKEVHFYGEHSREKRKLSNRGFLWLRCQGEEIN